VSLVACCRVLGDSDVPMPNAAQGISYAELDSSEFMSLCDLDEEREALPNQVAFARSFGRRMQEEGGFERCVCGCVPLLDFSGNACMMLTSRRL
jgi:hypothetical protein